MNTYRRWPVQFESGSGCHLTSSDGRRFLDFIGGLAVSSVGHCHPKVTEAIAVQAGQLVHVSNLYRTAPQEELSFRLAALTGGMSSFFCNSGAEAVECALKLARRWGGPKGKTRIITAEGSFHGRTFGALSATGQPEKRAAFEPAVPGFTHVPFGDIQGLQEALGPDVAAVLLEPIQGEAGVVVPPPGYLAQARALCSEAGALLIFDEVQTGIGRTGRWFAFEHEGVAPDVICIGKALAGGLPMGACLAVPEVAGAFIPGDHGSTFGGGPVQSAAALAVLNIIEDEHLLAAAESRGQAITEALSEIGGLEVRGKGLLIGIKIASPIARAITQHAFESQLLVNDAAADVVRLAPPLVIGPEEAERGLSILKEAIHAQRTA